MTTGTASAIRASCSLGPRRLQARPLVGRRFHHDGQFRAISTPATTKAPAVRRPAPRRVRDVSVARLGVQRLTGKGPEATTKSRSPSSRSRSGRTASTSRRRRNAAEVVKHKPSQPARGPSQARRGAAATCWSSSTTAMTRQRASPRRDAAARARPDQRSARSGYAAHQAAHLNSAT